MRLALLFLVACGNGPVDTEPDAGVRIDGKVYEDAHVYMDAHVYEDAKVYMDAIPDAP